MPSLLSARTPQAVHHSIEFRQQNLTKLQTETASAPLLLDEINQRTCRPYHPSKSLRTSLFARARAPRLHTSPQPETANHSLTHSALRPAFDALNLLSRSRLCTSIQSSSALPSITVVSGTTRLSTRSLQNSPRPIWACKQLQHCESGTICGAAGGRRHLRPAARDAAQRVVRDVVRAWPQEWAVAWVVWHISLDVRRDFASVAGEGSVRPAVSTRTGCWIITHCWIGWLAGRLVDLDSVLLCFRLRLAVLVTACNGLRVRLFLRGG